MRYSSETVRRPYFSILVNGQVLDDAIMERVTSCQVTNSDEQSDSAKIQISDPDYIAFDSINIVEGAEVEVYGGYVGAYRRLMKGHIAGLDPNFPNNGAPTLTLVCMDETYPMSITQENVTWKSTKRSQIAQKLAMKYGFKAVIQDTGVIENSIAQSNETDAKFLQKIAQDVGFITYVRDGVLFFGQRNLNGASSATFTYYGADSTLMSFRPQFVVIKDVQSQIKQVITVDVTPTKKKTTTKVTQKKTSVKHSPKHNPTKNNPPKKKASRHKVYYHDAKGKLHWKYV